MPDCRDSNQPLKFVAIAQLGTLAAMFAYLLIVQKEYTIFAKHYTHLSQQNVETTQQYQALCASKNSLDHYIKYKQHYQIVFFTIVSSFILNLLFISFAAHLPRNALLATSFLVFAAGVVSMSFSAVAYSTIINKLNNEPPECRQLFNNLKKLFLVGIIIGTTQAIIAAYTGYTPITRR